MARNTTQVGLEDTLEDKISPATEDTLQSVVNAIEALSIGGGGTQYTEGDTDATITGTALMWEDAANTLVPVSSAKPLPVLASIDTTGLATEAKQDDLLDVFGTTTDVGIAVATDGTMMARLREMQSFLESIRDSVQSNDTDLNIDNTAFAFEVGYLRPQGYVYATSPTAITDGNMGAARMDSNRNVQVTFRDSSDVEIIPLTDTELRATPVVVDLGANNDVTLATLPDTAGGSLAAMTTDLAAIEVLLTTIEGNQLADGHNVTIDNASIAVTGTFYQATQPVSLASVPSHNVTNAGTFAVQAAQSGNWNINDISAGTQTNDIKITLDSEEVTANIKPLGSVGSGKKTIASAGTQEAIGASTAIDSVTVKALSTNTGLVYVGTSTVSSADGFQLSAGDSVSLDVDNLTDVYIDVDTNDEGISFIYIT